MNQDDVGISGGYKFKVMEADTWKPWPGWCLRLKDARSTAKAMCLDPNTRMRIYKVKGQTQVLVEEWRWREGRDPVAQKVTKP